MKTGQFPPSIFSCYLHTQNDNEQELEQAANRLAIFLVSLILHFDPINTSSTFPNIKLAS